MLIINILIRNIMVLMLSKANPVVVWVLINSYFKFNMELLHLFLCRPSKTYHNQIPIIQIIKIISSYSQIPPLPIQPQSNKILHSNLICKIISILSIMPNLQSPSISHHKTNNNKITIQIISIISNSNNIIRQQIISNSILD